MNSLNVKYFQLGDFDLGIGSSHLNDDLKR